MNYSEEYLEQIDFKAGGELTEEELQMVAGGKNKFSLVPTGPINPWGRPKISSWLQEIVNNFRIPTKWKR